MSGLLERTKAALGGLDVKERLRRAFPEHVRGAYGPMVTVAEPGQEGVVFVWLDIGLPCQPGDDHATQHPETGEWFQNRVCSIGLMPENAAHPLEKLAELMGKLIDSAIAAMKGVPACAADQPAVVESPDGPR